MVDQYIAQLVEYGLRTGLVDEADKIYVTNRVLEILHKSDYDAPEAVEEAPLETILANLLDWAVAQGLLEDNVTDRDLFDTKLMGALTPAPSVVRAKFAALYKEQGAKAATDWYYKFSQDTDYIRRYRICKDLKWVSETPWGELDITVNLSKPEKDPKAIAAAKLAPQSGLQRALHRLQQPAHPHEDRAGHLPQAAGFRQAVPPLFCGKQRRPAHRGRQHPEPRPFPGRPLHLCHGQGPHGAGVCVPGL